MDRNLVIHTAIQWLASEDLLVKWMDVIIDNNAEEHYVTRLHERMFSNTEETMLDFLVVMPYWGGTLEGDSFWQNKSDMWKRFLRTHRRQFNSKGGA